MKGKNKNNNKNNDNKKARTPVVSSNALSSEVLESSEGAVTNDFMDTPVSESRKGVTLSDLAEIDPELLTGKPGEAAAIPDLPSLPESKNSKTADQSSKTREIPTAITLDKNEDAIAKGKKRRNAGLFFVFFAVILVAVIAVVSFILDSGMDESFISPLNVHGRDVSSGEFSFMYHYELLSEGVDLFAADTEKMLSSPYLDDENFATYRDYFRYVTAQDIQKIDILYDDATSQGYEIEKAHYDRANAYINWLKGKADELGVPLDTYIKGVFGSQVDEQCIINTLSRKYFTEDYAEGEKLIQLSATDAQAESAYAQSRNIYDLVSYKIFRFTYEQREQAFIDTANLNAQRIIDAMGKDPSKFESCAAKYFTGAAAEKLRNCYIITVNNQMVDEMIPDIAANQALAQEIYDYVEDTGTCNEIENLYNDYILAGGLSVLHDSQIYKAKYQSVLADWIFAERNMGDKTLLEENGTFYVVFFVSESPNPEWYDRVNSFLRMNNYQQFITSKADEYTWTFNDDGLSQIKDVPQEASSPAK